MAAQKEYLWDVKQEILKEVKMELLKAYLRGEMKGHLTAVRSASSSDSLLVPLDSQME